MGDTARGAVGNPQLRIPGRKRRIGHRSSIPLMKAGRSKVSDIGLLCSSSAAVFKSTPAQPGGSSRAFPLPAGRAAVSLPAMTSVCAFASYACTPETSRGRLYAEPESATATCFQRGPRPHHPFGRRFGGWNTRRRCSSIMRATFFGHV
jgi:hypothetical protein